MQSMKEKAANVAASAKAGLEKTKATMEEKVVLSFPSPCILYIKNFF